MTTSGKQFQATARCRLILSLRQDSATASNHGVPRQHVSITAIHRSRLFASHACRIVAGKLALTRTLVDIGGRNRVGLDTKACEQLPPAWAGRCEN